MDAIYIGIIKFQDYMDVIQYTTVSKAMQIDSQIISTIE